MYWDELCQSHYYLAERLHHQPANQATANAERGWQVNYYKILDVRAGRVHVLVRRFLPVSSIFPILAPKSTMRPCNIKYLRNLQFIVLLLYQLVSVARPQFQFPVSRSCTFTCVKCLIQHLTCVKCLIIT